VQCIKLKLASIHRIRLHLSHPQQVREWVLAGLPADAVSIDNGILVTRCKRWPLMIDPQGQANAWVRALESRNGLRIIKPGDANFLRSLENCVRVGNPVLIGARGFRWLLWRGFVVHRVLYFCSLHRNHIQPVKIQASSPTTHK